MRDQILHTEKLMNGALVTPTPGKLTLSTGRLPHCLSTYIYIYPIKYAFSFVCLWSYLLHVTFFMIASLSLRLGLPQCQGNDSVRLYNVVTGAQWCIIKSMASQPFAQQIVQASKKESTVVLQYWDKMMTTIIYVFSFIKWLTWYNEYCTIVAHVLLLLLKC